MHTEPTLSTLIEDYLLIRSGELAEATVALTRRAWTLLITVCGDMPLTEFQPIHAEGFKGSLMKVYKEKSVETLLKSVHPLFRWWARHHKGYEDPFDGVKVKVPKRQPVCYTDAQLQALLKAALTTRDQLRILLGMTTGMRPGEIKNLTGDDIDWERKLIYVQPKEETADIWAWKPKDKDYRIVPMTDAVASLIIQVQAELPVSQPYLCLSEERYQWLQWRRSKGKMTDRQRKNPDSNDKPMHAIRKKAGVQGACLKHLRSTCFTTLVDKKVPLHVVQRVAGHSSIQTTRDYLADRPEDLDQVREVMSG